LVLDENEPNLTYNPANVTILERIHDKHDKTDLRAYKLLGIYLDEHLTLDYHGNHLTKKINYLKQFHLKLAYHKPIFSI